MKMAVFRVVALCSPAEVYQHFRVANYQSYFSKNTGSRMHRVAQNSNGEEDVSYNDAGGKKKGSGMPFQLVSS
jgi:hypothetical protein